MPLLLCNKNGTNLFCDCGMMQVVGRYDKGANKRRNNVCAWFESMPAHS